jgi:Glycosyl hydrolase family 99
MNTRNYLLGLVLTVLASLSLYRSVNAQIAPAGDVLIQNQTPSTTGVLHAAFYYPWFPETWGDPRDPFTNYHPSLGYYSSDDARVIANHVDAMIYAHLDAGISSWWGQGQHSENTRFPAQLAAANGKPFKWTLYYEKEGYGDPTVSELTADLNYIKSNYAHNSSYLTRNGNPVIFVWADANDGCGMADRWKQANAAVGNSFYVVLKVFPGYTSCASQPDGWHQYAPAGAGVAENDQPGYSFTISPGFWLKGEPAPRLDRDPSRWRTNIIDMVNSNEPLQLVGTFNEWGEGTAVESAQEWSSSSGYGTYLDALHNLLPPASQLGNISTRAFVQTGDNVMIGGFIVQGTAPKRVIIRAIGPELTQHGIPNPLYNPTLELHDGTGALIGRNDNWQTTIIGGIITLDQVQEIRDSGYAPGDARESAIIAELPGGKYTAIVRGVNSTTGVALVEVYDLSTGTASILYNISTRSFVQTGDKMIGGFIVQGTTTKRVIIRAIGPELGARPFNVPNALSDPTLELHEASRALIASNDNWQHTIIGGIITADQVSAIQSSGKAPGNASESAIIATLPPGNYTAIVRGVSNSTGVALVEVYDLD